MSQAERVVLLRQGARLPELDGIRGLAILPVLFLHWIVQPIEPLLRDLSPHLWALANLAWCGVDLFFVLSGFLIGGILLGHREAPNLSRAFSARCSSPCRSHPSRRKSAAAKCHSRLT